MPNPFFEINSSAQEQSNQKVSSSFKSKYILKHFQKIENFKQDVDRLPGDEEFFFLQTQNAFNAFTFIPRIIQEQSITHLYASTYSLSRRVIEALVELHTKGFIDRITLYISDSLIKRNPVTIDLLCALVANYGNIEVNFGWNHSKVALARTKNGYYVIEGSGNWSENAHIEQYIFSNSKEHYEFRREIFTQSEVRFRAKRGGIASS